MKLIASILAALSLLAIMVMLLLIPWFLRKYPPDPRNEGESINYIRELVAYKRKYNNWPVNAVFYGVIGAFSVSIITRIVDTLF